MSKQIMVTLDGSRVYLSTSEAAMKIDQQALVIRAAHEWAEARMAFISLGANATGSRAALNRLSDAENTLCTIAKELT